MNITILTPTYNRGKLLKNLYMSLLRQKNNNFEWLIIDDGSVDETKNIINDFIKEDKIKIKCIYQENGGKHRALNRGVSMIENELTVIVDSDDYLSDNAIEYINMYYSKYKNNKDLSGFCFLKSNSSNQVIGSKFKSNEYISDYITCRINDNIYGDKAEVFFTRCLKEFPFLEIENEKFLFEDYVWIQIGKKYKTVYINKILCIVQYLEDGLTKNVRKHKINSPLGMSARGIRLCIKECRTFVRIKGIIIYIAYGIIGNKRIKELYNCCDYKIFFIIFLIPSIVFRLYVSRGGNSE